MNSAISVFIPCYNSEGIIEDTVVKTYDFLTANFVDFELVIVDDTSKDKTISIVENLMLHRHKLKLVKNINGPSRRENLGKAMCENAKNEILFYFDADLAVPLKNIMVFVREIHAAPYDVCIGSRYGGIKPNRTFYRMFLSKMFNFLLRKLFNSRINDHICGFKAFRKDSFRLLYHDTGYDQTFIRGWFWDAELLINAQKRAMKIKEIPVEWNAGKESTFNFWREIKLLSYIKDKYKVLK